MKFLACLRIDLIKTFHMVSPFCHKKSHELIFDAIRSPLLVRRGSSFNIKINPQILVEYPNRRIAVKIEKYKNLPDNLQS